MSFWRQTSLGLRILANRRAADQDIAEGRWTPHLLSSEKKLSDGLTPVLECPTLTSQSTPLARLVPGSAPPRGCWARV